MKKGKVILLALIILINAIFTTGCWNYREIDKVSIVAGLAVDKEANDTYKLTAEVLQISGGKDPKIMSKTISMKGKTMFDAIRNGISLSGKKLYLSHTKVIILSKEIASEGVTKIIDWYNRDAETREDVRILISKEETAKEIFDGHVISDNIKSLVLNEILENGENLNKAPIINILKFNNEVKAKGMSAIIPTVHLKKIDGKITPQIMGTAIFKYDKLIGFLNGEETKDLSFIRNEVKGGLLIEAMQTNDVPAFISLEIFKSKTKVTPYLAGKDIKIDLTIETTVAIDEVVGTYDFMDEEGRKKLEQSAENALKKRIKSLIKKIQSEYGVDIFGFGAKLREDNPKVWKSVSNDWEEVFKDLKVNVNTHVRIKNSGSLSNYLEEGE